MTPAQLLAWLVSIWQRVYAVFETWYWRIRDAFETYWAQFWYVVVVWYGQAYRFFREHVSKLENVVITWYSRTRQAFEVRWDKLWQALSATWGFIWDHFYQGYKNIIDYTYSARADIIDTFTRFKYEFQAFRNNPARYIRNHLPQTLLDIWAYLSSVWSRVTYFFSQLYITITDFLSRVWAWLWERFAQWVKDALELVHTWRARISDFFTNLYLRVRDFLSRVWGFVYDHIPQEFKDAWGFLINRLERLKALLVTFWWELSAFLEDPYRYLTRKLQAWIEGWRDYIFGVVGDLFQGFQSSITDGLVRLTINLFPLGPVDRLPPYEYADLDSFIESMRWWLEGDGAKQEHGYDEIVKWAEENILKEKGLPR